MSLTVRRITAEQHLAHIDARAQGTGLVSALQVPGWARGEVRLAPRVAGLVRRRGARRRRAGALPPGPTAAALPGLPARGPGHRLARRGPGRPRDRRRPEQVHPLPDWLDPMLAHLRVGRRVRGQDRPADLDPPLGRGHAQGRDGRRWDRLRAARPPRRRDRRPGAGRRRRPRGRGLDPEALHRRRVRRRAAALRVPGAPGRAHRGRAARAGSTSCGGATSRRRPRPASRSARATSPTCRPSTTSTSRPPSATGSPPGACPTSSGCGPRCTPRTPTGSGSTSPSTRAPATPPRSPSGSTGTSGTPTARPPPRAATCARATRSSGR